MMNMLIVSKEYRMKILFVTSECAPFSKSGGLADVAFSLPPALKKAGNEIAVVTPYYKCVQEKYADQIHYVTHAYIQLGWRNLYCGLFRGELNGVTVWFIDNQDFFNRSRLYGYGDDALRFAFFSRAALSMMSMYDFWPDIVHCNDWETALAVIYLKEKQSEDQRFFHMRSVFTIHNIAYQGQFGASMLEDTFGLDGGWYQGGLGYEYEGRHDINLMKGAMLMADAVSTVSPNYARELHYHKYGMGLEGVADMVDSRLYGILNGIDEDFYNPATSSFLPAHYDADHMQGKKDCKLAIQKKFGLVQAGEWPLFASVARLVEQKGIELIKQILPGLMDLGVQIIVFGQGDQEYVDYFNWAKANWPGMVGFSTDFNEETANQVFAGADFYLMPSRFEPCGLSQMMAMRYGTVPIVHDTGGLRDSVRGYREFDGLGTGFSFIDYTGKALYLAVLEALRVYFGKKDVFRTMQYRCMKQDLSWDKSAVAYERMYARIADVSHNAKPTVAFDDAYRQLCEYYTAIHSAFLRYHPEYVEKDYSRAIQIHFYGMAEGTMYVAFQNGELNMAPYMYKNADAYIDAPYDVLVDVAEGKASFDEMFLNGRIRISGNLSKGYEIRRIIAPAPQEKKPDSVTK